MGVVSIWDNTPTVPNQFRDQTPLTNLLLIYSMLKLYIYIVGRRSVFVRSVATVDFRTRTETPSDYLQKMVLARCAPHILRVFTARNAHRTRPQSHKTLLGIGHRSSCSLQSQTKPSPRRTHPIAVSWIVYHPHPHPHRSLLLHKTYSTQVSTLLATNPTTKQ